MRPKYDTNNIQETIETKVQTKSNIYLVVFDYVLALSLTLLVASHMRINKRLPLKAPLLYRDKCAFHALRLNVLYTLNLLKGGIGE